MISGFLVRTLDEERSARGTCHYLSGGYFCHLISGYVRHAMLVDQKTEGVIVPLNEFLKSEGRLELANSMSHFSPVFM